MHYKILKTVAIILFILVIIGISCIAFLFIAGNNKSLSTNNFVQINEVQMGDNMNSESKENPNNNNVIISENMLDINEMIEESKMIPDYNLQFELPVQGATGYASIELNIRKEAHSSSNLVKKLSPGTGFEIIGENGNWLKIEANGITGWANKKYVMINLPDIIPSIIYDDTNSYSSLFKSSEIDIPNVTGKQLYNNKAYNKRLSKEEYMMPVMYEMAIKIMKAQELALKEGYSLKIYETYRPYEAQKTVSTNLRELMNSNKTVYNGINGGGWNEGWFIAQVLSNHQRGIAMDVSLVKINDYEVGKTGEYKYMVITDYTEEQMPTQMHELSNKAISMSYAVDSNSKTAWEKVPVAKNMTDGAMRLRDYCVAADLTPLCSEWWHFNDLDARENIGSNYSTGRYYITECYSAIPE